MFKKLLCIMMVTLLTVSLAACSKSSGEAASKGPEGTLSEIIDKIYEQKDPGLNLETREVDLTDTNALQYNTGLTDATLIKEATVSEALITSQAYSMALVRVKDSKDTEAVAKQMLDGINQNKWICVGADDLKVTASGDTIMLMMVQSSLSDTVTSDQIVDAFKTVCGGKVDLTLEKQQ
ncbi:hypothetical protein R2R35_06195 [Anaerocolumna sp. AGMB13020]|uniref:hypothetical protein n=1 Tax=Anaerocolumna sp. AGMB13020 TaxID=3081750 RepID=UPI002955D447|nr:hypothetical protein [Anaerocolumna sp. AGMB13020]WOO38089.1 hypothetical protein R2R35_06195 [Anaerocolumna sp. AGMB13020]